MRLRTASGLALASLAFTAAVMVLDPPGTGGETSTGTADTAVLVIPDDPAPGDCPETASPSPDWL